MTMYLLTPNGGGFQLTNLAAVPLLACRRDRLTAGTAVLLSNQEPEALMARFADILEALEDGTVTIYRTDKAIGYWKPKPKSKRTSTKAPAHHEPKTEA